MNIEKSENNKMFDEADLKDFGNKVNALIKRNNLTREEVKEMMRQVLLDEQTEMQQGAFLAALTAKEATPEEIAGCWESIYEYDTVKVTPVVSGPLVENCGTGMDTVKTFNISTAASIVAAAGGAYMAKHGARSITSKCGAVDIAEAVGVDVECDAEIVKGSIERAGIGLFNGMSPKTHPKGLARILSKIRFGSILNISASLANPAHPRYGVRGVYSRDLVVPVAQIMGEIGYKRAIVFHGLNEDGTKGIDEVSNLGETFIAELYEDEEIVTYAVTPEDFGIQRAREGALLPAADREEEASNFLRVLSDRDRGAKSEIVCLNAAPILYLVSHAEELKEGFDMAKEIIESGRAIGKLRDWVREQNTAPEIGERKLERISHTLTR